MALHPEIEDMLRPDPSDLHDVPGDPQREALDEMALDGYFDDLLVPEPVVPEYDYEPDPQWIEVVVDQDAPSA